VKVALSGDAGDELFCGYTRYQLTQRLWKTMVAEPLPLRRLLSRVLTRVSAQSWDRMIEAVQSLLPPGWRFASPGYKLHKGAGALHSTSIDALYRGLSSHWTEPAAVVAGATELPTLLTGGTPFLKNVDCVPRMMALDMLTYLPDDILVKVDRAAMGVSLETRIPLLDHRVVEFALRLPLSMKLRGGQTKWALRQVLYRHVPQALIDRPKMGFAVPIGQWLRGPLREWGEALLDGTRLRREGFLEPGPVRAMWEEHLRGRRNWEYHLWDVLMFQAWLETVAPDLRVSGDFAAAHAWGGAGGARGASLQIC
jgi:asparagine synthase (glutamine-hydrolysing)